MSRRTIFFKHGDHHVAICDATRTHGSAHQQNERTMIPSGRVVEWLEKAESTKGEFSEQKKNRREMYTLIPDGVATSSVTSMSGQLAARSCVYARREKGVERVTIQPREQQL